MAPQNNILPTLASEQPPSNAINSQERPAKSVDDFCRKYDISRTTAYAEMGSGALPYMQIRGLRRITPEGEAIWLERKTAKRGAVK